MSKKIASNAVQSDADVCNELDSPVIGVHAGGGIHVAIPDDWRARIAAGARVPGCSYAEVVEGTLHVPDRVLLQLENINELPVGLRARAAQLKAKTDVAPNGVQAKEVGR